MLQSASIQVRQDRVRERILPTLIGAIAALQGVFIVASVVQQQRYRQQERQDTEAAVSKVLQEETQNALGKMEAVMMAIVRDQGLTTALETVDLAALETRARPLFLRLRAEEDISHFYFHRPDRVVALRLHTELKGDLNDRATILQAETTGAPAAGLEQGQTGNAVLRAVFPWFADLPAVTDADWFTARENRQPLGYLELGIEFEDVLQRVTETLDVELLLAIDKTHLDRDLWRAKAQDLGLEPGWDKFPQLVVTNQTVENVPPTVQNVLAETEVATQQRSRQYRQGNRTYQAIFIPFANIEGENLGYVIALKNISDVVRPARTTLLVAIACSLALSGGLIALFYVLLGRIQDDLLRNREQLTRTNESLQNLAQQAAQTAAALTLRSQGMSAHAEQVSASAIAQASATEQVSRSMADMVQRIRENTSTANHAESGIQQTATQADHTRQAMLTAIDQMNVIIKQISILEELAMQTDLLALNAGIAATRTQQNQNEFAVIAAEIRKLAERAQQAAVAINQQASTSVGHIRQAEILLNQLVPSIETMVTTVKTISASSGEQLTTSTQIDRALQQLEQTTQQNSATARSLLESAQILATQAADLQGAILLRKANVNGSLSPSN